LENIKEELEIAVELPIKQPQLFKGRREACQFILLHGPPGTGKTQLARILASTTNRELYLMSSSDVISKWVGESARLIRLLFDAARAKRPAIIFFDEVDVICGHRTTHKSDSELKNELLVQMSGASFDNTGLLFIGATNLLDHVDPAFLSRFQKQIYIPMPGPQARLGILYRELGGAAIEIPAGTEVFQVEEWLKNRTEGFSGRDIKRLAQEALQGHPRRIVNAKRFETKQMPVCHLVS
jgi:vacuolar protein-sorting-associated protein 4